MPARRCSWPDMDLVSIVLALVSFAVFLALIEGLDRV
jgi:hypothetical protein